MATKTASDFGRKTYPVLGISRPSPRRNGDDTIPSVETIQSFGVGVCYRNLGPTKSILNVGVLPKECGPEKRVH